MSIGMQILGLVASLMNEAMQNDPTMIEGIIKSLTDNGNTNGVESLMGMRAMTQEVVSSRPSISQEELMGEVFKIFGNLV